MADYIGYGRTIEGGFRVTNLEAFENFCDKFNLKSFEMPSLNEHEETRYGFTCYNNESGEPKVWFNVELENGDEQEIEMHWEHECDEWLHPDDYIVFMHHGNEKDRYHSAYCVGVKVGYDPQYIQLPDTMNYRMANIDEFVD